MSGRFAAPGFHGKLPCAGDFVQRRLPAVFVEPWDAAMCRLQWRAGDAVRAPRVWKFALAPGICGGSAWVGALVASQDRVGRRFPLTIAAALANSACLPPWLTAAASLLEAAPAMEDISDFDRACRGLTGDVLLTPTQTPPYPRTGAVWWTDGSDGRGGAWIVTDGLPGADQADVLLGTGVELESVR